MPFQGNSKRLLSLPALLFVTLLMGPSIKVMAQCSEPVAPVFPAFDAADLTVMEIADKRLQAYIDDAEDYLECLGEDDRNRKMDGVLARIKEVTTRYNVLANRYRKSRTEKLFSDSP